MQTVWLSNDEMRVGLVPEYGARVVNLIDVASGRDWIAPGFLSPNTSEDAAYLADEAVGWDECFPTVSPWDASATAWGRRLRDHGELWGRAWPLTARNKTSATTEYEGRGYRFSRSLSLEGPTLRASYHIDNTGPITLPWMWALHCLLAVTPSDTIVLPGITAVGATYVGIGGEPRAAMSLHWPGPNPEVPFSLSAVQSADTHAAAKLYATGIAANTAFVGHGRQWLKIGWEGVAHLGIWLNYGGWPQPGDVHHIALEATSAPVDHLGDAVADGTALQLAPGESRKWSATIGLRSDTAEAGAAA